MTEDPLHDFVSAYVERLVRDIETAAMESMLPPVRGVFVVMHHHGPSVTHAVYLSPAIEPGVVQTFHCGGDICLHPDDE